MIIIAITIFTCPSAKAFLCFCSHQYRKWSFFFTDALVLDYKLVALTLYTIVLFFVIAIWNILMMRKLQKVV